MVKNVSITADEMKTLAKESVKGSQPIKDLLEKIHASAEKGNTSICISDCYIGDNHKVELERRGFKVSIGGRFNETNTSISWE